MEGISRYTMVGTYCKHVTRGHNDIFCDTQRMAILYKCGRYISNGDSQQLITFPTTWEYAAVPTPANHTVALQMGIPR